LDSQSFRQFLTSVCCLSSLGATIQLQCAAVRVEKLASGFVLLTRILLVFTCPHVLHSFKFRQNHSPGLRQPASRLTKCNY